MGDKRIKRQYVKKKSLEIKKRKDFKKEAKLSNFKKELVKKENKPKRKGKDVKKM